MARIPTYSIVSSLITLAMCASPFVVVIYAWRNWINHHKTRFRYLSLAAVLSEIGHLRLKSWLFRLHQPILLSAGGSKVSCSRFIQFLQAHTSTPERDATSLRSSPVAKCGGNLYFLSIRGIYIQSGIGGQKAAADFYKFTSKVLWSRRHLTSWKRLPLGSQIPRSLVPLRATSSESVPAVNL